MTNIKQISDQTKNPTDNYSEEYSEKIDWDIIYSTFHNPKDIAERIAFELETLKAPMVFCGFPEVAAYLATKAEVEFVDTSSAITARTQIRYPDIQTVTEGEISEILKQNPTRNIVISCRLSAFWQTQQAFDELASAILAHPRDQILIDFFDRDAVYEGMHIYYQVAGESKTDNDEQKEKKQQSGDWDFKQFDELQNSNPSIQIANIDVSYFIGSIGDNDDNNESDDKDDMDFSYETRRAFFTKTAILNWCTKAFPDYETTLASALLEEDPSFLVNLKISS